MKINPWVFGGLFLLMSSIWMWNNFEFPKFYPFEKVGKVETVVFRSKLVTPRLPGFATIGYDQIVDFVYEIDNVVYTSSYRAHKKGQFQETGDSLLVRYSVNNPERTDPILYYHNISGKHRRFSLSQSFLHTKSNGYKVLDLKENIFTYEDYDEYGKRLIKTTGTFVKQNNIIKLSPLIYYKERKVADATIEEPKPINKEFEKIHLSNFKENPDGTITEINTNLIYDLAGKK